MKIKKITYYAVLMFLMAFTSTATAAEVVFEGSIIQESYNSDDITLDTISVDYWQFTVNTEGTVTIDVLSWERDSNNDWSWVDLNGDGEQSFIDSSIHMFQDSLDAANIYVSNDDSLGSFGADGTISGKDSYISQAFDAGNYIIAISSCGYAPFFSVEEAVAGLNQKAIIPYSLGEGDHGDYRIAVTGDVSAVPLPGAVWLLGSGIIGLAAIRKKRVKK
ncbi:MAG: DVUA0089 family protein [Desulfobacteraceae bacterium]|jgi:hypothetical protein